METALEAMRIALAGFIIPFFFIFNPSITLVEGFTVPIFVWACLRLGLAVWLFSTGLIGYEKRALPIWQRTLRLAVGLALIIPIPIVEFASIATGALLVGIQRWRNSPQTSPETASF